MRRTETCQREDDAGLARAILYFVIAIYMVRKSSYKEGVIPFISGVGTLIVANAF